MDMFATRFASSTGIIDPDGKDAHKKLSCGKMVCNNCRNSTSWYDASAMAMSRFVDSLWYGAEAMPDGAAPPNTF